MTRNIIQFLDRVWKLAVLVTLGLAGLLWWSRKDAVEDYKDKTDEEANRRAGDANDAAADAVRLSPDQRAERMQRKGWFRD